MIEIRGESGPSSSLRPLEVFGTRSSFDGMFLFLTGLIAVLFAGFSFRRRCLNTPEAFITMPLERFRWLADRSETFRCLPATLR